MIVDFAGELMGDSFSAEFRIYNELHQLVCVGASGAYHCKYFTEKNRTIRIEVGPLTLTEGKYRIVLSLIAGLNRIDTWENAGVFRIIECRPFRSGGEIDTRTQGVCILPNSFYEIEA
jgi:lipopolysaccharide transport system ATP-binding protein